jgi:hypothetical protein
MASKRQNDRLTFEASIRANAVRYSVQLFLGRGQYDRAETNTLAEAIKIGAAMQSAHPTCQARPLYYAIEASGHSTTISPDQFNEEINMIKTAVTPGVTRETDAAKREKKIEAQRRWRAKKKAAAAQQSPAPLAPGSAEPPKPAPAPRCGVCKGKGAAIAAAREVYGAGAKIGADYKLQKTARGEWYWGPIETDPPARERSTRSTRTAKAPTGKRSEALASAERGEIPAAPDFTAETHKRWRQALAGVVALVDAGDVAGLEANTIEPRSSSRVAICRYRDHAIVALKARAAQKAAA